MPDRVLIINADDFGYDPAVTRGILESIRRGVVSSTTLIVNSPHAADAARQAIGVAVGLHLNLARFEPISPQFPGEFLNEGKLSEANAPQLPAEVVEMEALAQLDRLETLLGRPATHIDVHKHLHASPPVLQGIGATARARKLPMRAIDEQMRRALRLQGLRTTDHFIGDAGAEPYWTIARFRMALEQLPTGITELMCHPGYAPVAVSSGYALQREVELQTFTHSSARMLLDRCGVTVADFTALSRRT